MSTCHLRVVVLAWTTWIVRNSHGSFHPRPRLLPCVLTYCSNSGFVLQWKIAGNKNKLIIDFLTIYFRVVLFLFAFFTVGSRHLIWLYEELSEIQHWRQKGFISWLAVRVLLLLHHQLLTTWMIYESVTVWLHISFAISAPLLARILAKNYHSPVVEQEFRTLSYSCKANNNDKNSNRLH